MKKKCWFFHKWKYINGTMTTVVDGIFVTTEYDEFRICTKCNEVQEFQWDSQGGSWGSVSPNNVAILEHKLRNL